MKILLFEDDRRTANEMRRFLENTRGKGGVAFDSLDVFRSFDATKNAITQQNYDCYILDLVAATGESAEWEYIRDCVGNYLAGWYLFAKHICENDDNAVNKTAVFSEHIDDYLREYIGDNERSTADDRLAYSRLKEHGALITKSSGYGSLVDFINKIRDKESALPV
jgi:hypothetical protein